MTKRDMDLLNLADCLICFLTPEGEYEGKVSIVCTISKKIHVTGILFLPKRTPIGTLNFNFSDILSYKVICRPDKKKDISSRKFSNYSHPRARDTCIADDCSEAGDDESVQELCVEDLCEVEEYQLKIPPALSNRVPTKNIIIDNIGDVFHQAVTEIQQENCIGASFEGPKVGREGILTFIAISIPTCTYLFDIGTLKNEAFKGGLKKIFENPNIKKVIHDSRQPSDCLFHMYNTRLVHVFDTQVADLLVSIQRSENGKFSRRVSSLDTCLRTYLEIPEEHIHKPRSFHTFEERVIDSRLRPLLPEARDVILKNVLYLRLLKRELKLAMLTPFYRATELYLQVIQTASNRELLLDPSIPEEVPNDLILDGLQVVRFKEFEEVPPVVSSGPPYREVVNPIKRYVKLCKSDGYSPLASETEMSSSTSDTEMSSSTSDSQLPLKLTSIGRGRPQVRNLNELSPRSSDISSDNVPLSSNLKPVINGNLPSISRKVTRLLNETSPSSQEYSSSTSSASDLCKPVASDKLSSASRIVTRILNESSLSSREDSSYTSNASDYQNSPLFSCVSQYQVKPLNVPIEPYITNDPSDCEYDYMTSKSYQAIRCGLRKDRALPSSRQSGFIETSSESVGSSDEDPWATIRADYSPCQTDNRRLKFAPA